MNSGLKSRRSVCRRCKREAWRTEISSAQVSNTNTRLLVSKMGHILAIFIDGTSSGLSARVEVIRQAAAHPAWKTKLFIGVKRFLLRPGVQVNQNTESWAE